MKKRSLTMVLLSVLGTFCVASYAGDVKVNWQNPEKYTDIRPTNETRADFQVRVFKELDQVFTDMAKKLPDHTQWNVTVTDLDLAGDVNPLYFRGGHEIRIVKDLYWPRMNLSYTLTDEQGKVLASGTEEIKDMGFLMRSTIPSGNTAFQFEEQMLWDWFKKQQRDKVFPSR